MEKKKRPTSVPSNTERIECGCGYLYVTIGRVDGEIFEVFAALGRAGGCGYAQNEALTRSITLGIRYGVPVDDYIKQLKEIRCPNMGLDEGKDILSCAHAIAVALEKEMERGEAESPSTNYDNRL